jgi:hypothetical protein
MSDEWQRFSAAMMLLGYFAALLVVARQPPRSVRQNPRLRQKIRHQVINTRFQELCCRHENFSGLRLERLIKYFDRKSVIVTGRAWMIGGWAGHDRTMKRHRLAVANWPIASIFSAIATHESLHVMRHVFRVTTYYEEHRRKGLAGLAFRIQEENVVWNLTFQINGFNAVHAILATFAPTLINTAIVAWVVWR